MNTATIKQQWFGNVKNDVLSGMVVAMALIPEAIAFSIIAGVDPMVGLYASFCIAVVIAFMGGRPGMISAATGAMALLMVTLVKDHGLEYLLAATILTGILQFLLGVLRVGQLMKFIPRSVMVGFVNALAILIFTAQLPHFEGANWVMYAMVAGSLAIIYILPRFTKAVPAPLIAIILMTVITATSGLSLKTVGDMGELSSTLPIFLVPEIPLTFETLQIIFPISLALAFVGLLESLLTSQIVDDMTDTVSDKNKEARGQGIANITSGFFGGMAGCAMIGQSVINVSSGGRGRLSTLVAGVFLILLIISFNDILVQIPMAVLVGVMFMVSIGTFDWSSLTKFHKNPISDSVVMVVTVVSVVLTHNLSIGVLAGVILSAIFFVAKISKVHVEEKLEAETKTYFVSGQVFFASIESLMTQIDLNVEAKEVHIDFTHAHVWDDSGVAAIDKLVTKLEENDKLVKIGGLNPASSQLVNRLAAYQNKANAS
ncbi:SulP family inorganic anion transporter [Halobacillus shinanisalinarum]|uniref:SulP family inorganic anion transporter n=1 Tax=Halobacillus shinanisalinarum TaxID=2932258 RepID=A0ABY4GXF5_9BACI|nr:SulP family inorganic anion transporter [Halobacillus shinanisalinarum]UOQ92701.1 SulP family inorganic anion transporter [Halobacillus shinanisalinarum]